MALSKGVQEFVIEAIAAMCYCLRTVQKNVRKCDKML